MADKVSNPIEIARSKLQEVERALNNLLIGREEEVRLLLITTIAQENIAYIGPAGTGKSYMIRNYAKLLNASFSMYQFNKFTSDVEVLGPFDIPKLTKEGILERKMSRLFKADIAYLDEAFKASSAILNALLSALQERIIYDPITGSEIPIKTKIFIVTSNEVPQDEDLVALYDRFPVRCFVKYIDDDAMLLRALEARWLNGNNNTTAVASWNDVEELQQYAMKILRSEIKGLGKFITIYHSTSIPFIKSLRSKGIVVSDRTIIEKLPKLIASQCALYGLTVDNIVNAIIDFLPHLGKDEQEYNEIKNTIINEMGEVASLHDKLQSAKALAKGGNLDGALNKLEEIMTFDVTRLASKPWLKSRVEVIVKEAKTLYDKYSEIKKTLEEMAK
ncbi:MAG: hypothetical protein DRJ60_00315 [Thermoprotei archaeon]|nr:MAG: hypothetical protein DRJ60_00315 [Thermoprotei archaeon]